MNRDALAGFEVPLGTPAPQGSKSAIPIYRGRGADRVFTGKVALKESAAGVDAWRNHVIVYARRARGWAQPLDCPVVVWIDFRLARPRDHIGTGRNAGIVKPWALELVPAVKPDLDKLVRATLDALTMAAVYRDDALVVALHATKRYIDPAPPGARISVVAYEP